MGQIPATMKAMILTGHGGLDRYQWRTDWPVPVPAADEVLIKVAACGLNNTDVNTRTGWYSSQMTGATSDLPASDSTKDGPGALAGLDDPSWGGKPISFPLIQGADVCGRIVAVGPDVDPARIGERVITDNWLRDPADLGDIRKTGYYGSERDGGFAEYTTIPARNALAVNAALSDAELASFSCSYSTAEGMLARASVTNKDTVLVTGASGGVGCALVQLAKYRGARVIALASGAKQAAVSALGADRVLGRQVDNLKTELAGEQITVLADIVGGPQWVDLVDMLVPGGRLTCSGAIAGPIVSLDLRQLYLRDLTFTGSTVIDLAIMPAIVRYIESGVIKPVLAASYPLAELCAAQSAFMAKQQVGSIVVCP